MDKLKSFDEMSYLNVMKDMKQKNINKRSSASKKQDDNFGARAADILNLALKEKGKINR